MKTDRRKELKQNQLADYLAQWIVVVKPYTRLICGVVIAVVVVSGAMVWFKGQSEQALEKAWDDYYLKGITEERGRLAVDNEALAELASEKADQPVGQWASVSSADRRLAHGVRLVLQFGGWEPGQKELRTAVEEYEVVLGKADPEGDDFPRQKALFGQARAYESLGELAEAKKRYEQLIDPIEGWPEGSFARFAKQRLAAIDTPAVKQFYLELKNTVASQPNPFGTPDDAKSDPLKERSDRLKLPGPLDGGDFGGLLGIPSTLPDPPAGKTPAPSSPPDETTPEDTVPDSSKKGDAKKSGAKKDDAKQGDAKNTDVKNDSKPKPSDTLPDPQPKRSK